MINLNNRKFRAVETTENGEVSGETLFNYYQNGNIIWADYSGGSIVKGSLMAVMDEGGNLDMKYHHINKENKIMSGESKSTLEILDGGRIRYYEEWKWSSGYMSFGKSVVEEVER